MQTYGRYFSFRAVLSTTWHTTNTIMSADFIPRDCFGDPGFFYPLPYSTLTAGGVILLNKADLWCLQVIPHIGYSMHEKYDTFSWGILGVDRPWINRNWPRGNFLVMNMIYMSCFEKSQRKGHENKQKFSISSLSNLPYLLSWPYQIKKWYIQCPGTVLECKTTGIYFFC